MLESIKADIIYNMTTPYKTRKRFTPACAPDHECTDEEINWLIAENRDIMADVSAGIIHAYNNPTHDELIEIIERAKNYKGDWYHCEVTLNGDENVKEIDADLKKEVELLGADHGIALLYSFQLDPATEEKLKASFASLKSGFNDKDSDKITIIATDQIDSTDPDYQDYRLGLTHKALEEGLKPYRSTHTQDSNQTNE